MMRFIVLFAVLGIVSCQAETTSKQSGSGSKAGESDSEQAGMDAEFSNNNGEFVYAFQLNDKVMENSASESKDEADTAVKKDEAVAKQPNPREPVHNSKHMRFECDGKGKPKGIMTAFLTGRNSDGQSSHESAELTYNCSAPAKLRMVGLQNDAVYSLTLVLRNKDRTPLLVGQAKFMASDRSIKIKMLPPGKDYKDSDSVIVDIDFPSCPIASSCPFNPDVPTVECRYDAGKNVVLASKANTRECAVKSLEQKACRLYLPFTAEKVLCTIPPTPTGVQHAQVMFRINKLAAGEEYVDQRVKVQASDVNGKVLVAREFMLPKEIEGQIKVPNVSENQLIVWSNSSNSQKMQTKVSLQQPIKVEFAVELAKKKDPPLCQSVSCPDDPYGRTYQCSAMIGDRLLIESPEVSSRQCAEQIVIGKACIHGVTLTAADLRCAEMPTPLVKLIASIGFELGASNDVGTSQSPIAAKIFASSNGKLIAEFNFSVPSVMEREVEIPGRTVGETIVWSNSLTKETYSQVVDPRGPQDFRRFRLDPKLLWPPEVFACQITGSNSVAANSNALIRVSANKPGNYVLFVNGQMHSQGILNTAVITVPVKDEDLNLKFEARSDRGEKAFCSKSVLIVRPNTNLVEVNCLFDKATPEGSSQYCRIDYANICHANVGEMKCTKSVLWQSNHGSFMNVEGFCNGSRTSYDYVPYPQKPGSDVVAKIKGC